MYALFEQPLNFDQVNGQCREVLKEILHKVSLKPEEVSVQAGTDFMADESFAGSFYVLKEGNLSFHYEGKALYFVEEGDLIGTEHYFCGLGGSLTCEFAVVLNRYPAETFLQQIEKKSALNRKWMSYLTYRTLINTILLSAVVKEEEGNLPDIRYYDAGDVIIQEGAEATEVFTLIEGGADVTVKGTKVGQIQQDEIFGVLGALGNTPRVATVTANERTMVMVLNRDNFANLIESRPSTVVKMVEDMAKKIVALNERVLEAESNAAS